jgi:hypothetical protein
VHDLRRDDGVLVTVINFGRIGTCKLCQREAELQNSHVLSEFLYRELYDDKHRLAALSQDRKPISLQTGVKEPMLCRACEQGFSKWKPTLLENLRIFHQQATGLTAALFRIMALITQDSSYSSCR